MTTTPVTRVTSGAPWEPLVGYSRAVRSGSLVAVSGTTAGRDGSLAVPGGAAAQARHAIATILESLARVGAGAADVVQTRMYVTDVDAWRAVGEAHRHAFGAHPPATTLIEVRRLIHPELRVEIEALAWVPGPVMSTRAPARPAGPESDGSADYV